MCSFISSSGYSGACDNAFSRVSEILNYLPHTLPLESLHRIVPKDDVIAFQKCTEMCTQIMHAEHVKSLIMETGQQLLSTLKL